MIPVVVSFGFLPHQTAPSHDRAKMPNWRADCWIIFPKMRQPIDSRQIKVFATLANTSSFTVAAKNLFLSQSAVSHSIKALENDIGCRLFDRMGKKAILTQAGELLLVHAEKIIREMDTARESIDQLKHWGRSRLRIGASTSICEYVLPSVLRDFKRQFSRCSITVIPGDTPEAIEHLNQNRIDLAVALEPHREDRINFQHLFTDELVFLVHPTHPWALAGRIPRHEIGLQQYILYSKSSYMFRQVSDYFRTENIALKSVIELGSMSAMKEMAKLGLGIVILAPWIARRELDDGTLVALALGRRKLKRNWGILHLEARRFNLGEETFVALCRSIAEKLTDPHRE